MSNVDEVNQAIKDWIAEQSRIADHHIEGVIVEMTQEMKSRAPVKTGNLRRSIGYQRKKILNYVVEATADYAADVEFGTHDTPAQPFFYNTYEEFKADLTRNVT